MAGGYVLDASALLCLLNDEVGADRVEAILDDAGDALILPRSGEGDSAAGRVGWGEASTGVPHPALRATLPVPGRDFSPALFRVGHKDVGRRQPVRRGKSPLEKSNAIALGTLPSPRDTRRPSRYPLGRHRCLRRPHVDRRGAARSASPGHLRPRGLRGSRGRPDRAIPRGREPHGPR